MSMKVVKPATIDDTNFVSSSVAEDDYAAYSASTTYADGDRAISNHRIYESLQNANTGHAVTETAWWLDIGPTNLWAAFDTNVSTQTSASLSMTFRFRPGFCDHVCLENLSNVNEARVRLYDGVTLVYDQTKVCQVEVTNWWDYLFSPVRYKKTAIFDGIPPYGNGEVEVLLTGNGTIKCGVVVAGVADVIGIALYGTSVGILDYSTKEADQFGNVSFVERGYKKKADIPVVVNTSDVDYIAEVFSQYRAIPVFYIGDENFSSLHMLGIYRDFSEEIQYVTKSHCTLRLEGLV